MKNVEIIFFDRLDARADEALKKDSFDEFEKIRQEILDYVFPRTEFQELPHGREIFEFLFSEAEDEAGDCASYWDCLKWFEIFEETTVYAIDTCKTGKGKGFSGFDSSEIDAFIDDLYSRIDKGEEAYALNKAFLAKLYENSDIKGIPESKALHEKFLCEIESFCYDKYDYKEWAMWYRQLEKIILDTFAILEKD